MVNPMNEKGGRVTTFKRSSWTFAFGCFYVLLFIQVNLQLFKIKDYSYGKQVFRRKKVVARLHIGRRYVNESQPVIYTCT